MEERISFAIKSEEFGLVDVRGLQVYLLQPEIDPGHCWMSNNPESGLVNADITQFGLIGEQPGEIIDEGSVGKVPVLFAGRRGPCCLVNRELFQVVAEEFRNVSRHNLNDVTG